jgi:enolase
MSAIEKSGYAGKITIGMDVAAFEFLNKDGTYNLDFKNAKASGPESVLSGEGLAQMYADLCKDYPVHSIEDTFDQDDYKHYGVLMKKCPNIQIVGDDLLCTNPALIKKAIDQKLCNALLLKVNQIGSISESIDAVKMAKQAGWGVMTSHRSGETEDNYIADLAVGLCTGQIKTGTPCRPNAPRSTTS